MKRSENNYYMLWKERQVEINQIIIYSLTFMLKGYSCENTVMPGSENSFCSKATPYFVHCLLFDLGFFEEGVS